MSDPLSELRVASAEVARRAAHVAIEERMLAEIAATLPAPAAIPGTDPGAHLVSGEPEHLAAFWLTLDAINFGSGWFPTLRKRPGHSGYLTVAAGVRERFTQKGPWSAAELSHFEAREIAAVLGQDPGHELMELFAGALRDLGAHVAGDFQGRFLTVVERAGDSAVRLVAELARWRCFDDVSYYREVRVPFLKRAQITASDLTLAGVAGFKDLARLTMFADNLVPHVLRLDGGLSFDPALVRRIEHGALLEHGSPEEVEIRACAVHAVELIARLRPELTAAEIDRVLWQRGQEPRYKARPRHRSRSTAY